MPTTENNIEISSGSAHIVAEQKQRRRLTIALGLLVIALGVLLFKDRQFWFSSDQSADSEQTEQTPATAAPATATMATATTPTATTNSTQAAPVSAPPAAPTVTSRAKKTRSRTYHSAAAAAKTAAPKAAAPKVVTPEVATSKLATPKVTPAPVAVVQAAPESSQASAEGPVVTTTNRTILLPLDVEVQAGNQHRPVSTTNNSVKVDMQSTASAAFEGKNPALETQPDPDTVQGAEARVSLSPGTAERVSRSVNPEYPLLAKQMKVQGAVVLEALIDRGGSIQGLRVLSGPSILATAAREAVRQWRFKPYYEDGQPVETEARITVNFTISTY
ncbi:MAG TPA: TonB family protein [Terriglobales bacterium]|nr:TonB family protein [Terriglobales bacterium]